MRINRVPPLVFIAIMILRATASALDPTAVATAPNVTTAGGLSYSFTVRYTDDGEIDIGSIDGNDVRVTGAGGFNAAAALVGLENNRSGTQSTATYSITPPGGSWDFADNGTYNVVMQPSQVFDGIGNPVKAGQIGSFTVTAPASTPPPATGQVGNISTRLQVGTGDQVLIGGFIINGTQPKKVLVRAIGPSLTKLKVAGALANPMLTLVDGAGKVVAANDNWQTDANAAQIPVNLQPGDPAESAVLTTLTPGNYTAIVAGMGSTTGVALVEAYDLDQTVDSKLANISTRGSVQTADNVMIGGLIIQGSTPAKVIIRGRGSSLPGVANPLLDPTLDIFDANGGAVATNDNWQTDPGSAEMTADNLAPADPREAATLQSLAPGNYTAIVRGAGGTTGVGLVEVYNVQ